MRELSIENIEQSIRQATSELIEFAKKSCWNRIALNCLYILTEIKEEAGNFEEIRKKRNLANRHKKPVALQHAIVELKNSYADLYEIDLYIWKSMRDITIVEVQYLRKSSLDEEYQLTIKDSPPNLHCKIPIPPYSHKLEPINGKWLPVTKGKYDINWELGGFRHWWKMLIWKHLR